MVTQSSYPTVNHPNRVAKGGALLGGTRYRIPGLLKWSLLWSLQQCLADVCSQQPDRQRCMGGEGWTAKVISGALLGQLYLLGSSGKHLWCGQKKVSTLCLSRWIRVSGYDCRAYFHMAQTHSRPPVTGIVTDKKDCPEESKVWVIQEKRYLLECCRSSTASWARGGTVTLLCTLWPHLKHCVQVWVSQYKKDIKQLEPVQRRAMKVVKDMKGKVCEEPLRSFVLLSPEQRKLRVSSHYQCSSSFPCCPIFRSQKKQMLYTFHQLWVVFAHSNMNPQLFTRSLISLLTSAKQWHLQVFGETLHFQKALRESFWDESTVSQLPLTTVLSRMLRQPW